MEIVRLRGHLANVRPRVFFLDALIGNFLERVLVCVFFVLLFLLFYSYLLVAFLPELTATLAMARHLSVCWHRQYRDDRGYRKGSHFDHQQQEAARR